MAVIFHAIARAIIISGNKVLLARAKGQDNTFLPGGHIEAGEGTTTALQREIREETGAESEVGSYIGAVESDWNDKVGRHHEINHIFLCQLFPINSSEPVHSRESHLDFVWADLDFFEKYNILPSPIAEIINSRPWENGRTVWQSTIKQSGL